MSQIPIVDSHLHLWNPDNIPVKWLSGLPALNKPHLPTTLTEELKIDSKISFVAPNVEAVVFVETDVPSSYSLLEAEWVMHLSGLDKRIQGFVANAPVEDGEGVRVYLDALIKIGKGGKEGHNLLKGVRRIIQSEKPDFCLQPSFIEGVKLLSQYHLSFDICCKPQHLESVIQLVAACPDTQFILDHMGKPTISTNDSGFEKWSDDISKLAKLPNVYCKLSGIVTERMDETMEGVMGETKPNSTQAHTSSGGQWKPADLHKYVAHVIQAFGSLRVMFGSDWPVVKLAEVGYVDWLGDIATTATATLTKEEKEQVWSGNAKRFYNL